MSANIWVIDDDRSIRWVLEKALSQEGFAARCFEDGDEALNELEEGVAQPDVLISDVRMPGTDGLRMLRILQRKFPELPVIIMTAHSDLDSAVASYQGGAFEYLPKPFDVDEAVALVKRALRHRAEQSGAVVEQAPEVATEIIGEAPAMQEVFRAIGRLSHSNVTVLINGQSGTGKELVARALHNHSVRKDKSFVALNMAAIPKDLIESELFGHEKGSFTGANAQRIGRFEQANGGTLFLDEIGDMPLEAQTRLLRVLRKSNSIASAAPRRSRWMCASSLPHTRTWKNWSRTATSAKTFSTDSMSFVSTFRNCRNDARIFRAWRDTSCNAPRVNWVWKRRHCTRTPSVT